MFGDVSRCYTLASHQFRLPVSDDLRVHTVLIKAIHLVMHANSTLNC